MDFIRRHLALILQLILTVILVGAVVFRVFSSDRNGPEIVLPDSDIVLTDSTTDAQLFEGLTASDDADGDVSDSLKLESVTKVSDNLVLLVYAAKDKSNNVSTVTRALMTNGTFTYKGMIEAVGEPAAPGSAESDISYPPESGLAASSETMIPGESSIPSGTVNHAGSCFFLCAQTARNTRCAGIRDAECRLPQIVRKDMQNATRRRYKNPQTERREDIRHEAARPKGCGRAGAEY